jgi:low affinity Fe/Cu permease
LAIQLKLSELVLAMKGAENKFAAIEDFTDAELKKLHDDSRARPCSRSKGENRVQEITVTIHAPSRTEQKSLPGRLHSL